MKLFGLVLILPTVFCWKPIAGPNAFSLTQTHPVGPTAKKLSSSHSTAISDDASSSQSFNTLTYHSGNEFLDDNVPGHMSSTIYSAGGATESRVLSGKTPYFHGKIFAGLLGGGSKKFGDTCSVDKYAMEHEGTVQYQSKIPSLEQLTLCAWMRFTNHSGDHVLFTYSVDDEPREIQLWIANARGSSFISMAVHGQSLFRLNYPFKMRKWHHACASWNGKTGEWQLWIKAERVGRGFHNRLVNFKVRPHGIAFSGGPSHTGAVADSLHAEVTLIQMYKIALSAGKAHRDHKHHHVHHFDHNGPITSTPAPQPPPAVPPQPINPLLANGQFPSRVRINLAGAQSTPSPLPSQLVGQQQQTINTQFVNGQFHAGGRILAEQLLTGNLLQQAQFASPSPTPFTFPVGPSSPASPTFGQAPHFLFKRDKKVVKKRQATSSGMTIATMGNDRKVGKRGLVQLSDGGIIDDSLLDTPYVFDGLAQFGLPAFKEGLTKMMDIEDEIKEHDREPAEGEVQAVMAVCSSCDEEPFEGALVWAWKHNRGRPHGALKAKTMGGCGNF